MSPTPTSSRARRKPALGFRFSAGAARDRRHDLHDIAVGEPVFAGAVQDQFVVHREVQHRVVPLGAKARQAPVEQIDQLGNRPDRLRDGQRIGAALPQGHRQTDRDRHQSAGAPSTVSSS
jgi:hypothetical protein